MKRSRRSFGAVRQRCRSGEGESRGRVSELLHCLLTLIDDEPHHCKRLVTTAGALSQERPGCRGTLGGEGEAKGTRPGREKWVASTFTLLFLVRNAGMRAAARVVAGPLLYSLCRSCRPRDPGHLQPALHGSPQRIPDDNLS